MLQMSRTLKARKLARDLGIPRRTMTNICRNTPDLAYKDRKGQWVVRVSELAKRPGFDLIQALMVTTTRWIPAAALARILGIPPRTMTHHCANRTYNAKRIGRNWYVDLSQMDAPEELIAEWLGQYRQTAAA